MSVRGRAIKIRVERTRQYDECWQKTTDSLKALSYRISTCIADRDGHRRLDNDGSPPLAEPYDPYLDLVQATVQASSPSPQPAKQED